ncbi:MAG TPA: sigma-70 family RNA polymerase sigma factor [Gemmataceae bacterium]|nr:sigma-70 family RNA polymerase sigma factor [Gemmataceae bacterium]
MTEVTRILSAIEQGDAKAAEQLLPLVYDELRKLAAQRLAQENPGQTLQATALVHEAYVRLVDGAGERSWNGRTHFFRAAAEVMRRILVDNARAKQSQKRGGAWQRVDLDSAVELEEDPAPDVLAVHEALDLLVQHDSVKAELVKLRYFAGLSIEEAAEVLGISRATADRYWRYAKTWLYCALTRETNPDAT